MSLVFLPPARCDFSHARKGKRPFQRKTLDKGHFPFSRGENRISQGVESRGSLISVPLALRASKYQQLESASAIVSATVTILKNQSVSVMSSNSQKHLLDTDFLPALVSRECTACSRCILLRARTNAMSSIMVSPFSWMWNWPPLLACLISSHAIGTNFN